MPDFNPNDMDALFREGAERHEFQYNADSWALMEEKLDKKANKRRILFYLLGLALLVGGIFTFSYLGFDNDHNEKEAIASSLLTNKTEKTQDVISSVVKDEIETPSNNTANANIQPEIKEEYISTDSKVSSGNIGAQNSFQSESTGNLIGNEVVSIHSQDEAVQNEKIKPSNDFVSDNIELESIKNVESNEVKAKINALSIPLLVNREFKLFDRVGIDLELFDLKPTQTSIAPIVMSASNRFTVTVFANPEWSSAGLFKESKAGWSFGTRVGYQFADKFEVSAGLAFSRKIYKGAGAEYTMEGGWIYDIEPMQMDAKCDVIEIPVGLTYYTNGFRNSGFFADLGINSYMLHSEWYGFNYNDALVRPERYKEVIEDNENSHLVGVGRLAIGYQKVLSNKSSLQIAPYLQFPLTGIGAGRVNLYSSGVQIAVKFNTQ